MRLEMYSSSCFTAYAFFDVLAVLCGFLDVFNPRPIYLD